MKLVFFCLFVFFHVFLHAEIKTFTIEKGSYDDPSKFPGMAHLVEHLILRSLTGDGNDPFNAYTTENQITFLIQNESTLEKIKAFLENPVFSKEDIKKEISIIDEEFHRASRNELQRQHHVLQEVLGTKFSMGNRKSLEGISEKEIVDWIKKPSTLPIKRDETPTNQMIFIEPLIPTQRLTILWTSHINENSMPVAHILGDEGSQSVLSLLKKEQLATGIICSLDEKHSQIQLQIELTVKGTKKVTDVIKKCYEAVATFQERKIPQREEWPNANAINEHFKDLKPEKAQYIVTVPKNISEVAFDHKEKWMGVPYGLKPITDDIMTSWKSAKFSPEIDFPKENPYTPHPLQLISEGGSIKKMPDPKVIYDSEHGFVSYAKDEWFQLPMISVEFYIKTPTIYPNKAETQVLGDLFLEIARDSLSPSINMAKNAGTVLTLQRKENGIAVTVHGYNTQAIGLLDEVLTQLSLLQIDEKTFKICKSSLHKKYQSMHRQSPLGLVFEILSKATETDFSLTRSKAMQVNKITFPRFQKFSKSLFKETFLDGVIYGSLTQEQAKNLVENSVKTLHSKPYSKEKQWITASVDLPQMPVHYDVRSKCSANAALLAIQANPKTEKNIVAQKVLMQALKDPFYHELRTNQHTAYIVTSKVKESKSHVYNIFAVESTSHDGRDLLARFELFLENFCDAFQSGKYSQESFLKDKRKVIEELQECPKNLNEMRAHLHRLERNNILAKECESLTYDEFLLIALNTIGKSNKQRLAITHTSSTLDGTLKYKKISSLKMLTQE